MNFQYHCIALTVLKYLEEKVQQCSRVYVKHCDNMCGIILIVVVCIQVQCSILKLKRGWRLSVFLLGVFVPSDPR